MIVLAILLLSTVKAYIDHKRWPFERHVVGAIMVAAALAGSCYYSWSLYPIFLFGLIFNPTINLMHGKAFFYMGNTAWTDIFLRSIFDDVAGQSWFVFNLIGLILTI